MAKGVYVQWSKSSGATGYYVFRRGSGEKWSRIATITSADKLAYLDTNVTNGKIYAYTVRAYYGSYLSSFNSTGKGIRVMSQPVLGTISNVSNGIKINWTKSVGATGYYVYRKVAGGSWSRVGTIKSVNTLTYTDKSAVAGKTYAYTVRAYNSSYVSYYNTTGKGIRCLKAPTTKLTAAKGKTTVSWTKSTGAAGYYIYRKTSTGSWAKIATIKSGSTVSYVDKTTKAGTKYYYTIRAYYGNYYSVLSNAPGVTAK
jgi:hypothetical protein